MFSSPASLRSFLRRFTILPTSDALTRRAVTGKSLRASSNKRTKSSERSLSARSSHVPSGLKPPAFRKALIASFLPLSFSTNAQVLRRTTSKTPFVVSASRGIFSHNAWTRAPTSVPSCKRPSLSNRGSKRISTASGSTNGACATCFASLSRLTRMGSSETLSTSIGAGAAGAAASAADAGAVPAAGAGAALLATSAMAPAMAPGGSPELIYYRDGSRVAAAGDGRCGDAEQRPSFSTASRRS